MLVPSWILAWAASAKQAGVSDRFLAVAITCLVAALFIAVVFEGRRLYGALPILGNAKFIAVVLSITIAAAICTQVLRLGTGFLTDEGNWKWVDRASWIAVIIGLPLLLYQVTVIRQDQVRKPKIALGVVTSEAAVSRMTTSNDFTYGTDRTVTVTMLVRNVGDRTAQHLLMNYQFPSNPDLEVVPESQSGQFTTNAGLWTEELEWLHPLITATFTASIRLNSKFTKGTIKIQGVAFMEKYPVAREELALRVSPNTPPTAETTTPEHRVQS